VVLTALVALSQLPPVTVDVANVKGCPTTVAVTLTNELEEGPPFLPLNASVVGEALIWSGAVTVMLNVLIAAAACTSSARAPKLKTPAVVGVPLITPLLLRVRPGGRAPEATFHV